MDSPPASEPASSGLEARVARLEASVEYIQRDIAEIKADLRSFEGTLSRLAAAVDRMQGMLEATLPTVATKAEVANLRAELTAEIARRPTTLGVIAVVAILIAIAGLPYWPHWLTDLRALIGAPS
jgi:hypothetical protein